MYLIPKVCCVPPLIFTLALVSASFLQADDTHQREITIHADRPLVASFLGAGVQWSAYPHWHVSERDWQKVFDRLDYMKLSLTRVMVDMTSYFRGLDEQRQPIYSFDNPIMLKVYRLLDYCKKRDVKVLFGQWGAANTAIRTGGRWDFPVDGPLHAEIVGQLAEHMVRTRAYSNIHWFNMINEPNGSWSSIQGDSKLWTDTIARLHAEFEKRQLVPQVKIVGPDNSGSAWLEYVALPSDTLRRVLGAYEEHIYLQRSSVQSGKLEARIRRTIQAIALRDPGKAYLLGEYGMLDGKNHRDQQKNVYEFWYGLAMADIACQLLRAGADGFIAWDLDDAMHYAGDSDGPLHHPQDAWERRKIWGLWNILGAEHGDPEDEHLRPWFFPQALISRSFPAGSRILSVSDSGQPGLRVAAALIPTGTAPDISFLIVNHSPQPHQVKLTTSGAAVTTKLNFELYEYCDADGDNRVDAWSTVVDAQGQDLFPQPSEVLEQVATDEGIVLHVPASAVIILSSVHGTGPDSTLD